jgi:hypothetical protein
MEFEPCSDENPSMREVELQKANQFIVYQNMTLLEHVLRPPISASSSSSSSSSSSVACAVQEAAGACKEVSTMTPRAGPRQPERDDVAHNPASRQNPYLELITYLVSHVYEKIHPMDLVALEYTWRLVSEAMSREKAFYRPVRREQAATLCTYVSIMHRTLKTISLSEHDGDGGGRAAIY